MEEADRIAARILTAHDAGASIDRISDTNPGFDVPAAYGVARALAAKRAARGEKRVGWKIGYTNRAVQREYGVLQPIWGPMYDTTVVGFAAGERGEVSLANLAEPRIEPEIVVRIARAPDPAMEPAELIGCIDAVGHGFEVVTSVYRDWRGTAADSVAGGSLHGRYFHGPLTAIDGSRDWVKTLADVQVTIYRDGVAMDTGRGSNALDGPISALSHFIRGLDAVTGERLAPGEIVTTGTLTKAFRVAPGETWTTTIAGGLALPGMALRFR